MTRFSRATCHAARMCGAESTAGDFPRSPFTTTQWTVVLAAADTQNPKCAAALEHLCRVYWEPVYAFIRRKTPNPEEAKDLAQGFFAHFLAARSFGAADPQRGRFRSFLLAAVTHFLADEHARRTALKRGGNSLPFSLDLPGADQLFDPANAETPESLYNRRWALLQLERALAQVADDYRASGRGALFDLLQDYVWGDKAGATLAQIAAQLDLTEEAVKKAVQRLRQRFRDCLRAEIARTVSSPDQIDDELRHLRAALAS